MKTQILIIFISFIIIQNTNELEKFSSTISKNDSCYELNKNYIKKSFKYTFEFKSLAYLFGNTKFNIQFPMPHFIIIKKLA
jgi:hypothetical protein